MALRIVATLVATSLVAACGFKGPLYLPPEPGQTDPAPPQLPNIPPPDTLP
ncbi:LPS translocon maturation chaperone LptM [Bordetella petrii]|uniref:LPS translocon maturation chaperone LptM n=1 Tax=Bordetella petrii TaxID=94624 RepID=UPI001E574C6E|nr:lipoprotein [Bordetella petrii]MCD0502367.1 lipoprotein [Bordetella petrii]